MTLGDIIEPELRTKTPSSSVQRSQQKAHFCNLRVAIIGNQGQVLRVHCPAPDAGNESEGDVATLHTLFSWIT